MLKDNLAICSHGFVDIIQCAYKHNQSHAYAQTLSHKRIQSVYGAKNEVNAIPQQHNSTHIEIQEIGSK